MTPEEKKLGIRAAKLFNNRHKMRDYPYSGRPPTVDNCIICGEQGTHMGLKSRYCPIDINDWNVAMMLVRVFEADAKYSFILRALYDRYEAHDRRVPINFEAWLILYATPADHILAACIAKEGEQ